MRQHRFAIGAWAVLVLVASVVCLGSPLFGHLGFAFALVATVPLGFGALHVGARLGAERAGRALGDVERAVIDAAPLRALVQTLAIAWRVAALWLAIPLVVMLVAATSCGLASGLEWFAIQTISTTLFAATFGVCAGVVFAPKPRLAIGLAIIASLGSIGLALWRLYVYPPVFVYDLFWGYFPGSLYDEQVSIGAPLVWARVYAFAIAALLVLVIALFSDGKSRFAWRAARGRTALLLAMLTMLTLAIALHVEAPALGFRRTEADVIAALGGARRSAHFVVYYRREIAPQGIDRLLEEAEFRYAALAARLGTTPTQRVSIFAFDSVELKRTLIGLAETSMARPWRAQILIDGWSVPHAVLNHELVHVFANELGDRWFGLPLRGFHLATGLVEGFAVALDHDSDADDDVDAAAKLMRAQHSLPSIADLFTPRFLLQPPARAYAAAGSFCRFLVERDGAAKLAALYHEGGTDAAARSIYGADLPTLERAWLAFLDQRVTGELTATNRDRLRRPSVFLRRCPHELATRRAAAMALFSVDVDRGIDALESLCAEDPDRPEHVELAMKEAIGHARPERGASLARRLLAHPDASDAQRANAHEALGDLLLRAGQSTASLAHFDAALAVSADGPIERLRWVKRVAALLPPSEMATLLVKYLYNDGPQLFHVAELARLAPSTGLFAYLVARQLQNQQQASAAIWAERAQTLGLPDQRFTIQAQQIAMESAFVAGEFAVAQRACAALAVNDPESARIWSKRIAFAANYRAPPAIDNASPAR